MAINIYIYIYIYRFHASPKLINVMNSSEVSFNMRNIQWQIIYSILNRFVDDLKVWFVVQCALKGSITWDSNQIKWEG